MSVEMVPCKLNGKYDIILPKHRAERPEWYSEKGWERERLDSMHANIKPGDLVYYVGAEEGEMPALCQMWGAKVVLFEPNPKVWPNIKAIWEANRLEKPARMFQGFASSVTKIDEPAMSMADWTNWSWWPSCADEEVIGNHGFKELHLEADNYKQVTLDSFSYGAPTVISLDVEGSEFEVLRGAEQTLERHHPIIYLSLHPEFMFNYWGEYSYDLRRWIIDKGYNEKLLSYEHEVHLVYWPVGTELA